MAASGARIINLGEFRRRRALREQEQEASSKSAARMMQTLCVWYPVWYWVPVVTGV